MRCFRILLALTMVGLVGLIPARASAATGGWQWPEAPTMSEGATTQACADLLFIGVRGSGEAAPYGDTVQLVRDRFAERSQDAAAGQASVREVAISYPAASPHTLGEIGPEQLLFAEELPTTEYFASAESGAANLAAVLDDSQRRCPNERWVIAGFSQGSQVITAALDGRTGADSSQLISATLLGNPSHYPGQLLRTELGDAPTAGTGLVSALYYVRQAGREGRSDGDLRGVQATVQALLRLSQGEIDDAQMSTTAREHRLRIPSQVSDRVSSICATDDIICNAGPGLGRVALGISTLTEEIDRARPAHLGYSGEEVDEANATAYTELVDLLPEPGEELPPAEEPPTGPAEDEGFVVIAIVGAGFTALLVAAGGIVLRRRQVRRRAAVEAIDAEPRDAQLREAESRGAGSREAGSRDAGDGTVPAEDDEQLRIR